MVPSGENLASTYFDFAPPRKVFFNSRDGYSYTSTQARSSSSSSPFFLFTQPASPSQRAKAIRSGCTAIAPISRNRRERMKKLSSSSLAVVFFMCKNWTKFPTKNATVSSSTKVTLSRLMLFKPKLRFKFTRSE